jgi:hypothetical protein
MTSISQRFKAGDRREDGYIFAFYKGNTPKFMSPEAYHRRKINNTLSAARLRAKKQCIPFDLDTEYLLSIFPHNSKCPVFGIELEWDGNSRNSPSLDRLTPELGYVRGNVMFISNYANMLKSMHTLDTLRTLLHFYESIPRGN